MKPIDILSLLPTLRVNIHPEQKRRIEVIDTEDYSGVMRKTLEHFSEIGFVPAQGYMERGVFALKQYYAVALLDPANAHAISRSLDPFWHMHILHTEQYFDFCERVMGEYMHHIPLNHSESQQVALVRRLYDYTLEVLPKLFHEVDSEFWQSCVSNADLICLHKGNQGLYEDVQSYRLFDPTSEGSEAA